MTYMKVTNGYLTQGIRLLLWYLSVNAAIVIWTFNARHRLHMYRGMFSRATDIEN